VQVVSVTITGILAYAWLGAHTLASLLVVAILYGFFSGALIGLPPIATASMTKDMSTYGARMGLIFAFMGLGSLIGTPVTGAIVEGSRNGNGYDGARIWSATTIVVGGAFMAGSRMLLAREKGNFLVRV